MRMMLPFTTLLLVTKIQKTFCSAIFLAQRSKLLKKFVHCWQVLKHNRNHYCFQCHPARQGHHVNCRMNYIARETLFRGLGKAWSREAHSVGQTGSPGTGLVRPHSLVLTP
ncbi:hypothetical protein VULLAG_LOCUS8734 [Vulpes lagopus]